MIWGITSLALLSISTLHAVLEGLAYLNPGDKPVQAGCLCMLKQVPFLHMWHQQDYALEEGSCHGLRKAVSGTEEEAAPLTAAIVLDEVVQHLQQTMIHVMHLSAAGL